MTHARFDLDTADTADTADPDAGREPDPGAGRTDLSSAFGDSAADSLRGLLAPRRAPVRAVDAPDGGAEPDAAAPGAPTGPDAPNGPDAPSKPDTPPEPAARRPTRQAVPARRTPERTAAGPTAPKPATPVPATPKPATPGRATRGDARPSRTVPGRATPRATAPTHRRGPRPTQVRDREDVDLLMLAVLGDGVANGREIVALVRDRSGGTVELTERRVYQELQRLRHNRLIADTGRGGRARFVLTESGQRILHARARRWQAYTRAMGRVLGAE